MRIVTLALLVGIAGCNRGAAGGPPGGSSGASSGSSTAASPPAHDLAPTAPAFVPMDLPRFDVHTHIEPGALARAVKLLGAHKIVELANLSGGSPGGDGLEDTLAEARAVGHTVVYVNPDFREIWKGGAYGVRIAAKITEAARLGAKGIKISKGLGLGHARVRLARGQAPTRAQLVPVDDKGLDPLFEAAGRLHLPISIHTGDPKAFWQPIGPENERFDELRVHPGWSFYRYPEDKPIGWDELYAQFERRVARHPKTIFVGVHFGNDPEDPARVAQMLDRHPNLYIDTAARIPEIGRRDANHDAARMRAFFEKYQDRILFGTDVGVGVDPQDLMLGSTGATPPGPADVERFFTSSWRWFETNDRDIPSPTPIQGRWNIDGIGLPREVLEKIYYKNAERLLGVSIDAKSP